MDALFEQSGPSSTAPLAARARPLSLSEIVGHGELLSQLGVLNQLTSTGRSFSLIMGGPPGIGKTSLARLVAKEIDAYFEELSATSAGVKEVKEVVASAKRRREYGQGQTLCFIDEIHRFSKTQQDALLAPVEEGIFTLLGATTENPYVSLSPALLSRSKVVQLQPLQVRDLTEILQRASAYDRIDLSNDIALAISQSSSGDARRAIGTLEAATANKRLRLGIPPSEPISLDPKDLEDFEQFRSKGLDASSHYELTSALIKSMRASDVEAAIYYLARLLVAGEMPQFIARRLAIFASEDIGLSNNAALTFANATYALVEKVGMPESQYLLAHAVIYLTRSAKSTYVSRAISVATELAKRTQAVPVPSHLRGTITRVEASRSHSSQASDQGRSSIAKPVSNLPIEIQPGFLPTVE